MPPLSSSCNKTNKQSKQSKRSHEHSGYIEWKGVKAKNLEDLAQTIKAKFNWTHEIRPFQLDAIKAQLTRRDVLVHAGTGSGKTAIAAGPHALEEVKGMVTFMISPLIALQLEQVETFKNEFGIHAIAINSDNGGCTTDVMNRICKGEWQIVILSPEMMLAKRFIKHVIRNKDLAHRVMSIVIDEAHVVSHWGSGFRKKYGTLGILRALLPKSTPMIAMSATLPARVRSDVLHKLQYNQKTYLDLNVGNDRPNVSLVVRAIQNPMNTFVDLAFVVPEGITDPKQIKKTFIYADDINIGADIQDYLYSRCPESWRNLGDDGPIRPYSAVFSPEHRNTLMRLYKEGRIRVLVCTDAVGMGCNIPDVDLVVQWRLPASLSSFVQRAGRAARGPSRTGLAVLLVEKSVYSADLEAGMAEKEPVSGKKKKKKTIRQSETYPKGKEGYAQAHGVKRGAVGGLSDGVPALDVPIDFNAVDEGLYSFVQTSKCRRSFLTKIYNNQPAAPTVACCDICNPQLLNKTRPAKYTKPKRKAAVEKGELNEGVREALEEWRRDLWAKEFPLAQFGPTAILKDATLDLIASVGPIQHVIDLEKLVDGWVWFGRFGDSLLSLLRGLAIPPMVPIPKEAKGTKRKRPASVQQSTVVEKRARVDAGRPPPAPNHAPDTSASHTTSSPFPQPGIQYPHQYSHPYQHQYQYQYHYHQQPQTYLYPSQHQHHQHSHHSPFPLHPHPRFQWESMPSSSSDVPQTPPPPSTLVFRVYNPNSSSSSRR